MNPNDWRIAQALFLDALEIPSPERETYLTESGESEPILVEVRKMLAADESGTGFAEPPSPELLAKTISPESYLEGTTLGDFELFEELGRGGMGIVYRAKQTSLDREVAIKVLPPALAASKLRLARFHREALAASKLDHPGVAPVLAFGTEEGITFYAMKLVEGPTLQSVLKSARSGGATSEPHPGNPESCARFLHTLLEGIGHIHDHHILHRDIKPANILCGKGEPTLIDFGLAKDLELTGLTGTGDVGGSPHYMSPEQVVATTAGIDERTDVYSAGAVLFEMLTLKAPFDGSAMPEIFHKIQEEIPPGLRKLNPDLPRDLEVIVQKALEKDPADRYGTASAMAEDLAAFLAGTPITARPVSLSKRAKSSATKKRSLVRIGPALLLFGAAAGTWAYQQNFGPEAQARAAMPRLVITAGDAAGAKVWARTIDPVDQSASEAMDLGELEDGQLSVRLPEGDYRIVVQTEDGRFSEFRRELKASASTSLQPSLKRTHSSPTDMASIPGGLATNVVYLANPELNDEQLYSIQDVTIEPFWLSETTVTNGEFWTYLQESGRELPLDWRPPKTESEAGANEQPTTQSYEQNFANPPREDWLDLPVVRISWQDAQDYAEYYDMRLPTYAEQFWVGTRCLPEWLDLPEPQRLERLHYSEAEFAPQSTTGTHYIDSVLSSNRAQNQLGPDGLYHPLGNVMEWSADSSTLGGLPGLRYTFGGSLTTPVAEYATLGDGPTPGSMSSPLLGFRCARSLSIAP